METYTRINEVETETASLDEIEMQEIDTIEETESENVDVINEGAIIDTVESGGLTAEQLGNLNANTAARHTHDNKSNVLDLLGANKDGRLTYNGETVGTVIIGTSESQADFRQSNSEDARYIRNKPCYEYGYYLDSADGVEVDYLSRYDDEQADRETFRKAIKVCDSLDDPSILLSLESDQIELENKNEKLNSLGFDWNEYEDSIVSFLCGIEYIKNTTERKGEIIDGEQLTVTLSPGLYFYVDDVVEQDSRVKSIFIPTETKKLSQRLLPESLGRSGIKSKTYDFHSIDVGAETTGNGIVDFIVYESEEGFFDNKVIVDVTWEDEELGYVDTGVLIDNFLLDGGCIASVLNRPTYIEMLMGYCVFRLYSPDFEGYADLVKNGAAVVNNITIKYIEV